MKRKLYGDGQQFHKYINKTNIHLSPQLIEHEKTHNIYKNVHVCGKSKSWFGTGTNMWQG